MLASNRTKKTHTEVCLRVGAGIGHAEKAGAGMLVLEVLVGKLLTVDGLATSALRIVSI